MKNLDEINKRIVELESELRTLQQEKDRLCQSKTVSYPPELSAPFEKAQQQVGDYFNKIQFNPEEANISIDGERYVLMRASSLSIDFFETILRLYEDKGSKEATKIGQNFLFDISHVIGVEDAKEFHEKLSLTDPVSKLSAGPVHFAHSGWAYVDIVESNPSPDENFYLKYKHPHSFEADAWINKGKTADFPVCIMNAGYSSGWCEQSFGVPLTSVELKCRAKGDDCCLFVMAHPQKINEHLDKDEELKDSSAPYEIPKFFERKQVEQELISSLEEKTMLLQEVHHRVKNNLQIISSLLNLQSQYFEGADSLAKFNDMRNRIKAIAMVHERFYKSDDVQHANFTEYIGSIVDLLRETFGTEIHINLNTDKVLETKVPIEKAIPCGLVINEIVTNAMKHAFTEDQKSAPTINIELELNDHRTKMVISDNGRGLPEDFDINQSDSLGLELVCSLVDQLEGSIDVKSNNGTTFVLECGRH
ncbi:histidine kinase dimerization/phosphoacceptor domain -containing protein [Parvicella tangerina]|uniref:Histidine kinase domain-containing protein n=1 Tax=Parvicella tangerina TaxID=2829795 RepID=A0A916JK17_9FLAO|nr:histidine kinase dimerization/phosphoacceptor domain -containing protein [Parvicella tangerina]CAG5076961.1 hypothetical protein CRYO30217_00256 [Parvicella tangerina]